MRTGHRSHRAWARALGVMIGLAAGGAGAAPPPSVKVTITPTPGASAVPRTPIAQAPRALGPPAAAATEVMSGHGLEGEPRPEQEQILVDLVASTPDTATDEKADYLFLLAELYARLHRTWRVKSAELALRAEAERTPKAKAEASAAAERIKLFEKKADKVFKALVNDERFHKFPRLDKAMFYYGATLQGAGRMDEARKIYHRLLKQYPQSSYAPQAYLAFAEHFFEQAQLADAQRLYQQVLKYPKSPVYWYAMYKYGWIKLNQQAYQEALESFFQVVQGTKLDMAQQHLRRAALSDFVRAYAEIGKVDKAFAAFQRVDAGQATAMLQNLADIYLEQGKTDASIAAYQELIRISPGDPYLCQWQFNLACATAYSAGTGAAQAVEICAQDLGRFKDWARASGVPISCQGCGPAPQRP